MPNKSYIKIKENYFNLTRKLEDVEYKLEKYYYILDIYMLEKKQKEKIDKYKCDNKFNNIDNLVILRDFNNEYHQVIMFNDEILCSDVKNIFTTKKVLEKLDYVEHTYINQDIAIYIKNYTQIKILDLKKLGIYIEIDYNSKEKKQILKLLTELNIEYIENSDNLNDLFTTFLGER